MEYKADPDKVFENINRALGDAIQTAIIGGLFYACKQYRRKPKLKRVQHSSTACPLCQSHCGEYSVDEYERIVDNLGYMGYNMYSLKNTLKQNHIMYKGLNVTFKDANDYVFEIQFHTKQSYEIKESMHGLYEEYRVLESNSDRAKELTRKMISISDKIKMPEGADRI